MSPSRRQCRCGTYLSRDTTGDLCGPCTRRLTVADPVPPEVPADFWDTPAMRAALATRHMGKVLTAYRTHPFHGSPISQATVATWARCAQPHVSRIENGPAIDSIAKLVSWSTLLGIPKRHQWFAGAYGKAVSNPLSAESKAHVPSADVVAVRKFEPDYEFHQTLERSKDFKSMPTSRSWHTFEKTSSVNSIATMEIKSALASYGKSFHFAPPQSGQEVSLESIEQDLDATFRAYQGARFINAASRIPDLLSDSQSAVLQAEGDEQLRAYGVLALAYQATASVLVKIGCPDLAWMAADRGFSAARQSGSTLIIGSLARSVAFVLMATGQLESAMDLVDSGAIAIEGESLNSHAHTSVYGTLLLVGAMAAARFGAGDKADAYLKEARFQARRVPVGANHLWTAFGSANVEIHRVNVAAELGEMQAVLESNLAIDTIPIPLERQVRYRLEVAQAYAVTGDHDAAFSTLLDIERIAPDQVRQHHLTGKAVMIMLRKSQFKPSVQLDKFARRVRLDGHQE